MPQYFWKLKCKKYKICYFHLLFFTCYFAPYLIIHMCDLILSYTDIHFDQVISWRTFNDIYLRCRFYFLVLLMEFTTSLMSKTDRKILIPIRMLNFLSPIVSINLSLKAYAINAKRGLREYLSIATMYQTLENGHFWVIFKRETSN